MKKTYLVTASIEIEVCDCENEYEAIDHATDLIDLGNFSDGAFRVHYKCLTKQEQKEFEKQEC